MSAAHRLFWILLMTLSATMTFAQDTGMERLGVYVTVSDIDKSREFYEKLFQKAPYVKTDGFVGFDVAGGLYALFAEAGHDRPLVRGNSTVPYIKVSDATKEFARVEKLARMLDAQVVREGPIELFRFADPDGNVIEFFSLAKG